MGRFVLRRVLFLILTLFAASVVAFVVPNLGDQDPARMIVQSRVNDPAADPAAVESIREQFGLDEALPVRYVRWLGAVLSGDLGRSFTSNERVIDLIVQSLSVTAVLAMSALSIAFVLGVPVGLFAAMKAGGKFDNAVITVAQSFVAVPEYWLAPLGMLAFGVWLGVLPIAGWRGPSSVIMPATVLALRPLAFLLTVARASMVNVLDSPYITAARARGLSRFSTVRRHGFRNAMVPVATLFGIWFSGLVGGSVVVEVIFAIPGMGRLMYQSVVNADLPVIQAGIVVVVAAVVLINTLTDIVYVGLNPAIEVGAPNG